MSKDYQQLLLIKKFVKNKFKITIHACPTVRSKDKMALSSRNELLTNADIKKSSYVASLLFNFKRKMKNDISFKKNRINIIDKINTLKKIKIEYLEIRNKINLSKNYNQKNFKIFIAYYNNKVRLIDNY